MKISSIKKQLPLLFLLLLAVFRVGRYCGGDIKTCLLQEKQDQPEAPLFLQKLNPHFEAIRERATYIARKHLPSPHSELLLGMVIGIDNFNKIPFFKQALIDTGTIHVVVVSGYNISLVFSLVWSLLGSFYHKGKLTVGLAVGLLYAGLSGFQPPVIRAWIMGSIAYLGRHHGTSFPTVRVLLISVLAMILWQPAFLFSLSFQLSFSATASLILFSDFVKQKLSFISHIPELFREDLICTIAAQILVWPLLSYYFGRVSWISVLVNMFILWTVPLATVLGGIFLLAALVGEFAAQILAFVVYIPLDTFVFIIKIFSNLNIPQVNFQISSAIMVGYYSVLLLFLLFKARRAKSSSPNNSDVDITTSNRDFGASPLTLN